MDWPRPFHGDPALVPLLPSQKTSNCTRARAMRLGSRTVELPNSTRSACRQRFGIETPGAVAQSLSRACLSLFELLSFRQIIPPDRAVSEVVCDDVHAVIDASCIVLQVLQAVCVAAEQHGAPSGLQHTVVSPSVFILSIVVRNS